MSSLSQSRLGGPASTSQRTNVASVPATTTEAPRRKLPEVQRYALWHPASGVNVSLLSGMLPLNVAPIDSVAMKDYSLPRELYDANIYLAFYPRKSILASHLFAPLDISDTQLSNLVERVVPNSPRYILKPSTIEAWQALENALLDVAECLLTNHPLSANFPLLQQPRWPHRFGYRESHESYDIAYSCARRARLAFTMLSGFVSFAFSLWLTEFEDDCFEDAVTMLASRRRDPLPRVWLQYLTTSVICDLSPGLRPGCFLDPYTTRWGPILRRFCRARVPVWLVWGFQYESVRQLDL